MKTLLRYPGGKSRAVKHILPYFPKELTELCSPFFGGGAVEFALASKGVKIYGYDSFEPLTKFWEVALATPALLAKEVKEYHPMDKDTFYRIQREHSLYMNPIDVAASFYALNRASFSGSTLSGGMSPSHPRFNASSIKRLAEFRAPNVSVACMDFKNSLAKHPDTFLYCDPPYVIESMLYGNKGSTHKGFDHEGLASILKARTGWVLSYNNCDYVKELYKGYDFVYPEWKYGMGADKQSKEILILG